MQGNSWHESDSYNDRVQINSLLSDLELSELELSELSESFSDQDENGNPFHRGMKGRRRKAAIALTAIWSGTVVLHFVSWGTWFVLGLTTLVGLHILRVLLARPIPLPEPLTGDDPQAYPYVSLLVAAKNEEAVVASLVEDLCSLDYPASRYDLWVIDDNSSDRTPLILERLAEHYEQLHVIRRSPNASGGKSGALNQAWVKTKGEIVAVFDADAQVPKDLLRRVLPLFQREAVGAVQVRKAIANTNANALTRGQAVEMAVDSYYQQQRIAIGGIGELRGNGQFVRRTALESCGGWNEETITDDLDLTIRLHLHRWDIDFLMLPAVEEEGVTRAIGLWHQRNRWAEGGYQRYLDYWRLLVRNRLGAAKTVDLFVFWVIQYILPTASVPDLVLAIARNSSPMFVPMTGLTITFSMLGMFLGLRRTQEATGDNELHRRSLPAFRAFFLSIFGAFYLFHWIPVLASTTARMAIRPKRLKWVKTIHHGTNDVWLDMVEEEGSP